ncbi:MAG: sigma-70 family RNA polymerase sigma factor [Pirellulales bacterium]|nr:sigma-70 family RNA polymerase sigma factor [Pirellulales bacterium]
MADLTQLLLRIDQGDRLAAESLLPIVYDELRQLAASKLAREKPGQTLDATGLVHEAYLRLASGADPRQWQGRNHFFAAAAEAMRRILVDRARRHQAHKHGGGHTRVDLDLAVSVAGREAAADLLILDEALDRLAAKWPAKAELVKLRYFAGLTMPECAETLGVSIATAERHWAFARSWLYAELRDADAAAGDHSPLAG